MAKGKYEAARRSSAKLLAAILAVILVFGGVVGGTVAWLIDQSQDVVNTFTYGDINIDLEETDSDDEDTDPDKNEYEMIPGQPIEKDPTVSILADSENCWVFVKLVKTDNFDDFLTYTIGDGWAALQQVNTDGTPMVDAEGNPVYVEGVYYRYQGETTETVSYEVLKDDQVTVLETVTKEMLNALDEDPEAVTYPKLTVTAYAVQYAGFEPELSEGATEATLDQVNAAALRAWEAAQAPATP